MIDATALDRGFAPAYVNDRMDLFKVVGADRIHLRADRGPNAFKMIPIVNGKRGRAAWIPRHLISH